MKDIIPERYIEIGEKRDHKFYKSEVLSLLEFSKLLVENRTIRQDPKRTLWNTLTGEYTRQVRENEVYREAEITLIKSVISHINTIIDLDKPREKRKKNKKEKIRYEKKRKKERNH